MHACAVCSVVSMHAVMRVIIEFAHKCVYTPCTQGYNYDSKGPYHAVKYSSAVQPQLTSET